MINSIYENYQLFAITVVIIQIIFSVIPYIYGQFMRPALSGDKINFKKYGKWAIVTGGSDGIGKQYARKLAKKGLNIILIALPQGLEETAREIRNDFRVETLTIAVDFTLPGTKIYNTIKNKIQGKEIGILINNVGMANAEWDVFLKIPNLEKHIQDLIQCNLLSVPMMCSLILPQMIERKRGLIINMSSISALIPTPCMTIYAGTKAFIYKFSTDLAIEYKNRGIIVQTVTPGPVATSFTRRDQGTISVPKADVFIKSAFKLIESASWTFGYWFHHVQYFYVTLLNFVCPSIVKMLLISRNIKDGDRKRQIRLAKNEKQK